MNYCLTICLLLIFSADCNAQFNQLLLRKHAKSHRIYREGSTITIETKLGMQFTGTIYLIQNDSLYFSGSAINTNEITAVLKKPTRQRRVIPFDNQTFLWANAGIPLFAGGLILSGEPTGRSLLSGVGLVYGPILLYNMQRIIANKGKRFPIGEKYDLRVLDLHRAESVPRNHP
jgi:hypothetical protein